MVLTWNIIPPVRSKKWTYSIARGSAARAHRYVLLTTLAQWRIYFPPRSHTSHDQSTASNQAYQSALWTACLIHLIRYNPPGSQMMNDSNLEVCSISPQANKTGVQNVPFGSEISWCIVMYWYENDPHVCRPGHIPVYTITTHFIIPIWTGPYTKSILHRRHVSLSQYE